MRHVLMFAFIICLRSELGDCFDRRRIFPNDEMEQLATALRQVARMLWGIHVTLQMGFEQEVRHSCFTLVLSLHS